MALEDIVKKAVNMMEYLAQRYMRCCVAWSLLKRDVK